MDIGWKSGDIFVLETANRDEIISEIASRIGLSTSEIKNIMEVEIEEGELEELKEELELKEEEMEPEETEHREASVFEYRQHN